MNKKRVFIIIKLSNRVLLDIKNLIKDKLDKLYIKLFEVVEVKNIIIKL